MPFRPYAANLDCKSFFCFSLLTINIVFIRPHYLRMMMIICSICYCFGMVVFLDNNHIYHKHHYYTDMAVFVDNIFNIHFGLIG